VQHVDDVHECHSAIAVFFRIEMVQIPIASTLFVKGCLGFRKLPGDRGFMRLLRGVVSSPDHMV
jgi:hypothetical protein